MGNSDVLTSKLDEMIKWIKLIAKPRIRELINQNLESELEFAVYELSDGQKSTRDISTKLLQEISHATVSNYWRRWYKLGILEPSTRYRGRFGKICSLEELGITLPPILKNNSQEGENEEGI